MIKPKPREEARQGSQEASLLHRSCLSPSLKRKRRNRQGYLQWFHCCETHASTKEQGADTEVLSARVDEVLEKRGLGHPSDGIYMFALVVNEMLHKPNEEGIDSRESEKIIRR